MAAAEASGPPMDQDGKENGDGPIYEEAPAAPHYDSVKEAAQGRPALVRSSTKGKTRRKSTLKASSRRKQAGKGSHKSSPAPQRGLFKEDATVLDILGTMKEGRSEGGDLVLRCLLEIERMVEMNEDNAEKLAMANDGVETILFVMKEAVNNDNVKATGCWVLSNLARAEESSIKLVQDGVADYTLSLMNESKDSEQVQHASLALLCNIALHESLRSKLNEKGTIGTVVTTLGIFPNHEWIQYTALQTLQNFANTESMCGDLMNFDTIPPLLQAMHYFNDHDELLQSCCWIISCLAFSGDDARRAILQRQHRVAKAIVQGMKDSAAHLGVQFTGSSALSNIARNGDLLNSLVTDGMVEAVTSALRRHTNHEGIQMAACRCLVVLAPNKQAKLQVKAAQGLALCERALDTFPSGPVAVEAQEALRLHSQGGGGGCCVLL